LRCLPRNTERIWNDSRGMQLQGGRSQQMIALGGLARFCALNIKAGTFDDQLIDRCSG
jgi:hypothetical protein